MRLTNREKKLLIILMFFAAGYFIFQYVITPQLSALSVIKAEIAGWEEKKQSLEVVQTTIETFEQRKSDLDADIHNIGNDYFSSLNKQEETLIVMNDILRDSGLTDIAIIFTPLEPLDLSAAKPAQGAVPIVQKVSVEFEGSYDEIWKALRGFWNFGKYIQIDSIQIEQKKDDVSTLSGFFDLSMYDLSLMTGEPGSMVLWSENGKFRKLNPFEPSNETFAGTRYILNVNNEDLRKYIKFTDISGNWAEAAIDDFGRQHLITGDSDNRYHPDEPMSRGELVILLDQFFKWEAPTEAVDLTKFADYNELGQSHSAMEKAFYRGYVMGCLIGFEDGTLRPNAPTTYMEFELFIQRSTNQPDFKWKDAALTIAQETGFQSPGADSDSAAISRAEVVYFLHSLQQP